MAPTELQASKLAALNPSPPQKKKKNPSRSQLRLKEHNDPKAPLGGWAQCRQGCSARMAGSRFAHVHGHLFRSSTFLESFRASGRTRTLRLAQALSRTTRIQFFNAGRSGRKFTLSPPLPLHSEPPHSPSHIKLIFGLPAPTADSGPGRDPSSGSNRHNI